MNGRLENEIKIKNVINKKIINMPEFVNEWYLNMMASNKTASSCNDFINKIKNYLLFLKPNIKDVCISDITEKSINEYYVSIQTYKNRDGVIINTSDSYKQGVWSALNNFLDFLYRRKYIEYNYIQNINKPKNKDLQRINNNRILLTEDNFKDIINAVQNGAGTNKAKNHQKCMKKRDISIMLLFMETGMRKTALSEINIQDINFEKRELQVVDKGNKIHYYYLTDNLVNCLNHWCEQRQKILNGDNNDALFISGNKQRLTGGAIYKIVEKYSEEALGTKISPHKLRSGFCSILYNKTKDAEFVRRAVGHSNITTTQRYIVTDNSEKKVAANIINESIFSF